MQASPSGPFRQCVARDAEDANASRQCVTWCGKWTIVTRMLGVTDTDEQFAFVVRWVLNQFLRLRSVPHNLAMLSASRLACGRL